MEYREFGVAEPYLRASVAIGCAYEFLALTTRKLPTLSRIARHHPWAGVTILAVLAHHFQPIER